MAYWTLYYHLIWATRERQPLLDAERETIGRTTFHTKANELRAVLHAVGSVADHVHVVASIPPVLSVATFVKHLKGASSRAANLRARTGRMFRWQEGYGVLSVGERSLATVVGYVRDQPQHHRHGTTLDIDETIDGGGTESPLRTTSSHRSWRIPFSGGRDRSAVRLFRPSRLDVVRSLQPRS